PHGATDDAPRAAEDDERHAVARPRVEQLLLHLAATVDEGPELPVVEGRAGGGEPRAHGMRERQVHVVAAEADVVADRAPLEDELAALLTDRDEREVRRSAADVADEDDVADAHLAPPGGTHPREPGIECRLRLLDEVRAQKAGGVGSAARELARDRV